MGNVQTTHATQASSGGISRPDRYKMRHHLGECPDLMCVQLGRHLERMSRPDVHNMVVAFSLLARILGECLTIHSLTALLKVEISSRTLISLFMPGSEEKKVFDVCVFCF